MGRYITTTATFATTTVTTGISYSARVNDRVLCTAGSITITLPSTNEDGSALAEGDTVQILDVAGVAGSSSITVGRNGNKIQGLTENLTIDIDNASPVLIYTGATYGWVLAGS
jgi:hypothetical protein